MLTATTITSKGQVFLPKSVREGTGIRPGERAFVSVVDGKVVIEAVPTLDEIRSFAKYKKPLSKKEQKRIVREAVLEKFRRKSKKWSL